MMHILHRCVSHFLNAQQILIRCYWICKFTQIEISVFVKLWGCSFLSQRKASHWYVCSKYCMILHAFAFCPFYWIDLCNQSYGIYGSNEKRQKCPWKKILRSLFQILSFTVAVVSWYLLKTINRMHLSVHLYTMSTMENVSCSTNLINLFCKFILYLWIEHSALMMIGQEKNIAWIWKADPKNTRKVNRSHREIR